MPYSSAIQLVNDANGTAYAFLADNGLIWQCQWNAEAQRWDKGQVVPGAEGGEHLEVLYVSDLWPNGETGGSGQGSIANAGLVLAYRVGEGNGSEIHASFGWWDADGQVNWSAPTALTHDAAAEQAFTLMLDEQDGGFRLVTQKQEEDPLAREALEQAAALKADGNQSLEEKIEALSTGSKPDTDLYRSSFSLQRESNTSSEVVEYNLLENGKTLASLQSIDQVTAAQPARNPLPFGGNRQLNRTDVVNYNTPPTPVSSTRLMAASAPSSTAAQAQSSASASSASRGWSGGAWSLGKNGQGGTISVGLSKFPMRWRFRNLYVRPLQPDPAPSDQEPSEGSLEDNPEIVIYLERVDGTSKLLASGGRSHSFSYSPLKNLSFYYNEPIEFAESVEAVPEYSSRGFIRTEDRNDAMIWSGVFGGTNVGNGGTSVVDFSKLQWAPISSYEQQRYSPGDPIPTESDGRIIAVTPMVAKTTLKTETPIKHSPLVAPLDQSINSQDLHLVALHCPVTSPKRALDLAIFMREEKCLTI